MTILQIAFVGHDQELNSDRILEARSPPVKDDVELYLIRK